MPTSYEVTAEAVLPIPLPDFDALKARGGDGIWEISNVPSIFPGRSLRNWGFYMAKEDKQLVPGVVDMWMRRTNGEKITQNALVYMVDSFPYNIHKFLASPAMRKFIGDSEKPQDKGEEAQKEAGDSCDNRATLWFPTVVMNLEVKMALPKEGWSG